MDALSQIWGKTHTAKENAYLAYPWSILSLSISYNISNYIQIKTWLLLLDDIVVTYTDHTTEGFLYDTYHFS